MKNKKKITIMVIGIIAAVGIIIGASYAWWNTRITQKGVNTIKSDCLKLSLVDENPISLEKAYPLTDKEAEELTPYTFTIENVCNTSIVYDVNIEVLETEERLKSEYIALAFNGNKKRLLNAYPSTSPSLENGVESYGLASGSLKGKESISYSLKLWMDEHVTAEDDAMNKEFLSKIVVNASLNQVVDAYSESILNGADPVLAEGLIPVEIGNDGRVTKANIQNEWYSYEEKRWANAVILLDKTIEYKDYEVIPEENIESYFVWIPKYSYEIWDLGEYESLTEIDESKVHEIPIKFGLNNTSDSVEGECTTPMNEERTQGLSGESGNCKVGDYMTPPAFISMGTNGLWVGKFETGYKGATSTAEAEVNANDSSKVQIKPNVYSWRNIQVSNAHLASYNYIREYDSHMMKNTEWGAVAYLQHSKYGSATSVRLNNNSAYITGYAAVKEPTVGMGYYKDCENTAVEMDGTNTINYKNPASQVASTTGNYTGIYDMSGGTMEYVFGVILDENNVLLSSSSGFNNETVFPNAKYYDTYKNSLDSTVYNYGILGDATKEMGPFGNAVYGIENRHISSWYKDNAWYLTTEASWFRRGGAYDYGTEAGIFRFVNDNGSERTWITFRIVLAI